MQLVSIFGEILPEIPQPPVGVVRPFIAAEGETPKAPFEQVIRGEEGDLSVVGFDEWNPWSRETPAQVHHRRLQALDGFQHSGIV
jgi:hypothetical protein